MKKIFIYGLIWLFLDQLTKYLVTSSVGLGESIEIISNFFNITYVRNTGAAWSILEGSRIFLILVAFIAIGLVYFFMLKDKKIEKIEEIGYGVLLGGILGNLLDRVIFGYVIDFFHFTFGNYTFPIFNIADIGIVIGTFIVIFIMIKEDIYGNKSRKGK